MLSKTLHELQDCKLVYRIQYNEVPPRVEYELSELGQAIHPALSLLGEWGKRVYMINENNRDLG